MRERHQWAHGLADYSIDGIRSVPPGVMNELLAREVPARFFYYFKAVRVLRVVDIDPPGQCIHFGFTRDDDEVCLSVDDLSVWESSSRVPNQSRPVNSSIDSFLEVMAVCEVLVSGHERVDDDDEMGEEFIERWIATSEKIRERIVEIDPTALFEGSYWSDFLTDVANGDYE